MSNAAAPEYPEELPIGYYLDNFQKILDFVDDHYGDILAAEEKRFSRDFRSLSTGARRLYVRLISRRGPLFRSDTLSYPEILDIAGTAEELTAAGFLECDEPREPADELALLRKTEILGLIDHLGPQSNVDPPQAGLTSLRKDQLVELTLSLGGDTRGWIGERFHVYRPAREREILVYRLLFFGNLYQDLTEFVVTDLGHVRYESYQIRKQDRLFRSREVMEHTLRLIELNETLYNTVEGRRVSEIDGNALIELLEYLPERNAVGEDPNLRRMRDNLINGIARHLERIGEDDEALHLYKLSELPPSRERRVRILERRERAGESLALCREILDDPWEEGEREFAERYTRKLSGKLGVSLPAAPRFEIAIELLNLGYEAEIGIEETVLRHFHRRGFTGYHAENTLWTGLFGLAFWDVVFRSLPGTFFNRYQRGPRDLFRPEFRRRREGSVRKRLHYIASSAKWPDELLELYDHKEGIASDLVHWRYLPRELVEQAVRRIPREHLVAIFDRLSEYPGANKSGFPDLILFASHREEVPAYELIEVKGPGDQLQINQRRWLKYFTLHGIPYRVIRVHWRE